VSRTTTPPTRFPITSRPAEREPGVETTRLMAPCVLLHGGDCWTLETELVIGREPSCDVVLDDPLVSRRHARLRAARDGVLVEDLHSRNGVHVNGLRIGGAQPLFDGDRVLMGTREISMRSRGASGQTPLAGAAAAEAPVVQFQSETKRSELFTVVGPMVERMLFESRVHEAEQVLAEPFGIVLGAARAGLPVPQAVADTASRLAVRLAVAARRGIWIDRIVELHLRLRAVVAADVIEALSGAVLCVPATNAALFRYYVEVLSPARERPSEEAERVARLAWLAAALPGSGP
jgi:hypothetical protein